jgi:hypothetical protein
VLAVVRCRLLFSFGFEEVHGGRWFGDEWKAGSVVVFNPAVADNGG